MEEHDHECSGKKKRKEIFKYLLPRGEGKDKQMLTGCV
jgi:hypothetical protein